MDSHLLKLIITKKKLQQEENVHRHKFYFSFNLKDNAIILIYN
jgi:hypothetical protein